MREVSPAFSFVLVMLAGWINRRQQQVIEYLKVENRMLKAKLKGRRLQFTDAERALLARHSKALGRKALLALETVVSPDMLLRWHRRLIARKWTFARLRRRTGRPGVMRDTTVLSSKTEGTVEVGLGAAYLAGMGAGAFSGFKDLKTGWLRLEEPV